MKKILAYSLLLVGFGFVGCEFNDFNNNPDKVIKAPIDYQLTSLTVNVGFMSGSDLNRYSSLLMQQYAGQSTGATTQTQQYETYTISGNDSNNLWSTIYATILNDAHNIITEAGKTNCPHYSGVAKILKAYTYQLLVDTYGSVPYFEAQQLSSNLKPKYDSDQVVYTQIISLLNEGIAEVNAINSEKSPGANSTIFPGAFASTKQKWVKLANTLKLRVFLHYSEKDATFAKSQIDALVNSGATFMSANSDSFNMEFIDAASSRNPIDQFETARVGQLVPNAKLVNMMNSLNDPRRPIYFTQFPAGSGNYVGSAAGGALGATNYSRFHTYLRGATTTGGYTGNAPIRMLTFAEYNFIRAEAALRFSSPGDAQSFFQAGIKASMSDAGVAQSDIDSYILANGTLSGTVDQKLEQIINQKFIANFGVVMEPWNDWRRTGYPSLAIPTGAIYNYVPRSLFYPQSEIDTNGDNVKQKTALSSRVFWDTKL